jgi:hypothetical protein
VTDAWVAFSGLSLNSRLFTVDAGALTAVNKVNAARVYKIRECGLVLQLGKRETSCVLLMRQKSPYGLQEVK